MADFESEQWLLDSAADSAIAERRRAHWLGVSATESSSFRGLLIDVAEAGIPVGLTMSHGKVLRGRVTSVGVDFVIVNLTAGPTAIGNIADISSLQPDRNISKSARLHESARTGTTDTRMVDEMARWCQDRPTVVATLTSSPTPIVGILSAVGVDLFTIEGGEPHQSPSYNSLSALSTVVTGSG